MPCLFDGSQIIQSFRFFVKRTFACYGGKNYAVGTKVRHPKFGLGTVISVKNGGSVINVAFDGQGIKELSAALAPLEIIQ